MQSDSNRGHPLTIGAGVLSGAGVIYNLLPVRPDVIPFPEVVGPLVWATVATVGWVGLLREWNSVRSFHLSQRRNPVVITGVGILGAVVFVSVWFLWGPIGNPPSNVETPSGGPVVTDEQKPIQPTNQSASGSQNTNIAGTNNTVTNNNVTMAPAMLPMVEGLTVSTKQVPSPNNDAPYALQVVVATQADVMPFGVGFVADQPFEVQRPGGVFFTVQQGTLNEAPTRSWFMRFESPAVTPTRPFVVTLMSKQPFRITKFVRMH